MYDFMYGGFYVIHVDFYCNKFVQEQNNRGAIHSFFDCTNDFNEYPISGDHVSDFNDFKSLWYKYHRLQIVFG